MSTLQENFDCCKKYLELLVQESDVRNCFVHSHQEFIDWMSFDAPKLDFSYAGIDDVVFPWKVINPKFRKIDIIDGYRAQYANKYYDERQPWVQRRQFCQTQRKTFESPAKSCLFFLSGQKCRQPERSRW